MLRGLKNQVICLALLFILQALFCSAQIPDNMNLQLNRNHKNTARRVPIPDSNEFKLSLGSQMFDSEENISNSDSLELSRVEVTDGFSDFDDELLYGKISLPGDLKFKTRLSDKRKRLGSIITLTNSYTETAGAFNNNTDEGLTVSSESGRLKVYGEYEKRVLPQPIFSGNQQEQHSTTSLRGSTAETITTGNTEPTDKNAALSSRYYLEAVYSFKPTLKGKVSFKRSMIDTFESEEELQVEGIVEANRNVLIKAGYNNEVRPEVTEPRSTKDTKVWTEFILKF